MKTLFVKKSFLIALALIILAGVVLGVCVGAAAKSASSINPNMPTVVIDAGHGGIDNGVQGIKTKTDEADINLAIARLLKGQFTGAGFNCVMTRTSEAGLYDDTSKGFKMRDMKKRKQIIEESGADMVISVHQNFCPLPSKRGGTVFFDKNSQSGTALAKKIQEELNALPQTVKPNEAMHGDYYMLKCTESPSVIVECGFLSNAQEDELLNDEDYQRTLAYAIFKGAVSYFANK
ncbi:MAG: N-acetylmuramoyl-L-alanine amidase [Clostridia bacterium]|nr:N-acetylmuramoyl-L-alanine amidase [Clostridia bacterium]MDE7401126.1 N-acetylmuramoyl-L-alanine amidase [Clostridia bacterium]